MWWAYYNPSNHTFVNTGVEYGYEEYDNQFGGIYGFYDPKRLMSMRMKTMRRIPAMVPTLWYSKLMLRAKNSHPLLLTIRLTCISMQLVIPLKRLTMRFSRHTVQYVPKVKTKSGTSSVSVTIIETFRGVVGDDMASKANFVVEN